MKFFGLLALVIVNMMVNLGCSEQVNTPKSESALQMEMTYTKACSDGKCPCDSPLGPIVDGGTALAYDTNQVACGATCETRAVTLVCKNGKFDRDTKPLSFSCQVSACKACTVGNNQVPHGFTVQMFNSNSVACGKSCDDNKRALVCKDGKLQGSLAGPSADGKDGVYSSASCLPQTCNCSIPDGGSMTAGGEMKFYKSSTGTCDIPCDDSKNMVKRTCAPVNGSSTTFAFSGDTSFSKSSCTERPTNLCGCTLPDTNKTALGHGKSKDIFGASAPYSCNTCDNIKITAYCDSGTLYDKPSTDSTRVVLSPSQLNSHKSLSCDPGLTPDCTINNICVADKTSKTLYGKTPLTCADNPSDSQALFSCANKALLQNGVAYNATTDIYKNSWQVSAPSNSCVGCALPWGGSVGVGSTVSMYKSSGNSSNSCGTGCKQIQMKCLADGSFDSGDASVNLDYKNNKSNYTQTCNNTCSQEGGGAPPRFCLLPWQNSFVSADALIPMWKKKTVYYGDSCQNYFRLGRCMLSTGTFDAGFQYIYKSCTELPFQGVRIDNVSPKFVTSAGGTITLTGAGFAAGMQVAIGKTTCSNVSVSSATQLTCTAPANSSLDSYDVLVTVGTKKAISPSGLSYYGGQCTGGPGQTVFKYTGSNQTFTVPAGCKSITITAWGAGGGGRQISVSGGFIGQVGGAGGFAKGTLAVTPGASYTVVVGGGGYGGYFSGSSGGGYAGVFSSTSIAAANAVIIAGGGGGAGDPTGCNKGGTGGEGGGATGGTHGTCSGTGGSQSAGGTGGASAKAGESLKGASIGSSVAGYAGAGTGNSYTSGGAGGGGYFGGGAGSEVTGLAGSGGGGSGYLSPSITNGTTTTGNGRMPPQTSDSKYQFGIGMGGNDPTGGTGSSTGGNGMIVISY
tara:strand:+ start:15085 stop:17796 length:2712 start_codon:yes stop_codon:yes gene_type:complete